MITWALLIGWSILEFFLAWGICELCEKLHLHGLMARPPEKDALTRAKVQSKIKEYQITFSKMVLLGIIYITPFSIVEELIFRAALFSGMFALGFGLTPVLIVSSILFALAHNDDWPRFRLPISQFLGGITLGMIYLFGGLWMAMACHFIFNVTAVVVGTVRYYSQSKGGIGSILNRRGRGVYRPDTAKWEEYLNGNSTAKGPA